MVVKSVAIFHCLCGPLNIVIDSPNDSNAFYKGLNLIIATSMIPATISRRQLQHNYYFMSSDHKHKIQGQRWLCSRLQAHILSSEHVHVPKIESFYCLTILASVAGLTSACV